MLTPRMRCVAAFVPAGCRVADVGCDHAYVPIALCERGICDFVIAMDVREGPLKIAGANVHKAGLDDRIELRLSDGLERLSAGEVDTVVIAGMGGLLTRDILIAGEPVVRGLRTMILQPQSELTEVRKYVRGHGFEIADEAMVWDKGKPYFVMKCESADGRTLPEWSETEYMYGGVLLGRQDKGLKDFLLWEHRHYERLIDRLTQQREQKRTDIMNDAGDRKVTGIMDEAGDSRGTQTRDKVEDRLVELRELLEYNRQAQIYYNR